MVAIQIDPKQMKRLTAALGNIKDGVPRALTAAVNRALASGKTTVKREIRKKYLIKAKDIPIAVMKATFGKPEGHIILRQGMLALSEFRFSPKSIRSKRPLYAQVKKGGGGFIRTGFVAQMESGHIAPFRRVGAARLPIQHLVTIGAPIMATQPDVGPAVNKAMGDTLAKRIDHEITRVLERSRGKY